MKLLALALISFALQASASSPRCGACSAGLVKVGGDGCYCGTGAGGVAEVFVAADEFCDTTLAATGTKMTTKRCTGGEADGTTAAAAACSCGANNEQVAIDEFCFVKADKDGVKSTSTTSACAVTTGLTAQPAGSSCYCGTDAVVVAADEFCDTTLDARGTKMTTKRCTGGEADGTTAAAAACSCGANNSQIDAGEKCYITPNNHGTKHGVACIDSTGLIANAIPICYCGNTAIGSKHCFYGAGVTTKTSSNPIGACTSTDGLTAQPAGRGCYCGSSSTLVAAGKFCDTTLAATGTALTEVRCDGAANVDGSTLTAAACSCGIDNTYTSTAQTCFLKADKTGDAAAIRAPAGNCATLTPCTASDSDKLAAACKCSVTSVINECVVDKFCWADKTCAASAKATAIKTFCDEVKAKTFADTFAGITKECMKHHQGKASLLTHAGCLKSDMGDTTVVTGETGLICTCRFSGEAGKETCEAYTANTSVSVFSKMTGSLVAFFVTISSTVLH